MNYRPYPDRDRALAQLERRCTPEPHGSLFLALAASVKAASDFEARITGLIAQARSTSKSAIIAAIAAQAVKAGEHVHIAGRDGVRCAGGDPACSLPSKEPNRCPGCGHAQHAPGTECEAGVDHGPNRFHRCLCLATPGASRACPAQMDCQGGPLRYADIWHLRQGHSLRGADGETITPDVLAEPHGGPEVTDQ